MVRNKTTQVMEENWVSNLSQLLRVLRERGYITSIAVLDPMASMSVMRARAWLPCIYWPELAADEEEGNAMQKQMASFLEEISSPVNIDVRLHLSDILMDPMDPSFEFWMNAADSESVAHSCEKREKWKEDHRMHYAKAGLAWPPVFCADAQQHAQDRGIRPREAEIIYHVEQTTAPHTGRGGDQPQFELVLGHDSIGQNSNLDTQVPLLSSETPGVVVGARSVALSGVQPPAMDAAAHPSPNYGSHGEQFPQP